MPRLVQHLFDQDCTSPVDEAVRDGDCEYLKYYDRALERGWHVGAIGGEDTHDTSWAQADKPKTVVLADDRTEGGIRSALAGRRFYAIRRAGLSLSFTVDGAPMGAQLRRRAGTSLRIRATSAPGAVVELIGPGGAVLASGKRALTLRRPASNTYCYVRVREGDGAVVAVSSPVWIQVAG